MGVSLSRGHWTKQHHEGHLPRHPLHHGTWRPWGSIHSFLSRSRCPCCPCCPSCSSPRCSSSSPCSSCCSPHCSSGSPRCSPCCPRCSPRGHCLPRPPNTTAVLLMLWNLLRFALLPSRLSVRRSRSP